MNTYDKFKLARTAERQAVNSKIKEAMQGISKDARLKFDINDKGNKKITADKNAAIKAMELVSGLFSQFTLPSKPQLEYHGIIKNATGKDGIVEEGVIRIGAVFRTLMGHKAHIDVPVIVHKKSLLEPSIFFFEEAPYVMCGPALDELVKRGTLMKEGQPRGMLSAPLEIKITSQDLERIPLMNLQHMFSPGHNLWNMKRKRGEKEPRKRTNIDTDTEMPELWEGDVELQCHDPAERPRDKLITVGDDVTADVDIEVRERGGGSLIIPSGEKGVVIRDEKGDGLCLNVRFPAMSIEAIVPKRMLKKKGQAGIYDTPESITAADAIPGGLADKKDVSKFDPKALAKGIKVEMEHTNDKNIAREIAMDHLTEDSKYYDALEEMEKKLEKKPKKKTKKKAVTSPEFILSQITEQVRKRNTPENIIDFIKSQYGSTQPQETQAALDMAAQQGILSKTAAASIDQMKKEVREMLREGYQKVDIEAAMRQRYPEQAEDALEGLN